MCRFLRYMSTSSKRRQTSKNGKLEFRRPKNEEVRPREYLTDAEVERLMKAAVAPRTLNALHGPLEADGLVFVCPSCVHAIVDNPEALEAPPGWSSGRYAISLVSAVNEAGLRIDALAPRLEPAVLLDASRPTRPRHASR